MKKNFILLVITAYSMLLASAASAQSSQTGFLDRVATVEGTEYLYQVFVPAEYSADDEWPVILFLHGAGERGSDGLKQTEVGLGSAIRKNADRWPAITIMPQVLTGESWQGVAAEVAMSALDATIEEFSVDEQRQYLTGLSLGGNGTWYLGYQHTERFAAMVAVCSFVGLGERFPSFVGDTDDVYMALATDLKNMPVWIFHGDADPVVPVDESRKMAQALESVGADVHYTELPGVGHNAWDKAYADQDMVAWLFEQKLN